MKSRRKKTMAPPRPEPVGRYFPASAGDAFVLRVSGTSFGERPAAIRALEPEQSLRLVRDRNNKVDKNAIAVTDPIRKTLLGYIPAHIAAPMSVFLDAGGHASAWLHMVKPGSTDILGDTIPDGLRIIVCLSDG